MIPPPVSVGAARKCCEKYIVNVAEYPEADGVYTRQAELLYGEWFWDQNNEEKPKYKILGVNSYWEFHKITYTSRGFSTKVLARAWDYQYSELCLEDTSGWRSYGDHYPAFTVTITRNNPSQSSKLSTVDYGPLYIPNRRRFSPFTKIVHFFRNWP